MKLTFKEILTTKERINNISIYYKIYFGIIETKEDKAQKFFNLYGLKEVIKKDLSYLIKKNKVHKMENIILIYNNFEKYGKDMIFLFERDKKCYVKEKKKLNE